MVCSIGTPYTFVRDYAEENLQSQDKEIENSSWFGNGARKLGLTGSVSPKEYQNLYLGLDKGGTSLKQQQKNRSHRPGRDLTFSAPKSVSISCLIEDKKELLIAHKQAVNKALSYVEQNCIYTRLGKGGRTKEQTDNIVAAVFNHQQSRNHDPHLHSHCVIFNLTQGRDSKWRTMDNRELYAQKMTIGMVYRHHLAQRLQQMGYSLNWNRDGTFEIANYSALQLEQFSSRRTEIINFAGVGSTTKEKARACIATRNTKSYINAERQQEIESNWKIKLHSLEFPKTQIKQSIAPPSRSETAHNSDRNQTQLETNVVTNATNVVTNAIATRLAESEIAFFQAELMKRICG